MVKHIVMWDVKEEVDDKAAAMLKVKELLEGLDHAVEGIISIKVIINEMDSSNRDLALISEYEDYEVLEKYQTCEGHVNAGVYIRSVLTNRACMDYEI